MICGLDWARWFKVGKPDTEDCVHGRPYQVLAVLRQGRSKSPDAIRGWSAVNKGSREDERVNVRVGCTPAERMQGLKVEIIVGGVQARGEHDVQRHRLRRPRIPLHPAPREASRDAPPARQGRKRVGEQGNREELP